MTNLQDNYIDTYPNGEIVYLNVKINAEYSSSFVSGFVYNPRLSLELDGQSYENGDVIRIELGQPCSATVYVSDRGHNNSTTQRVNGNQEFELMVDRNHTSQSVSINSGLVQTDVTLSFSRNVSFWDVIFR